MTVTREEWSSYWADYYAAVYGTGDTSVDHLSHRTQADAMCTALRLAGDLSGASVLDVGCGYGQLARAALAFDAGHVSAFDSSEDAISYLSAEAPGVDAVVADLNDPETWPEFVGGWDVVVVVEALQYAWSVTDTLRALWDCVATGGRMVGVVCNRDNGLVRDYEAQHSVYRSAGGVTATGLNAALRQLDGRGPWRMWGLHLGDDQTFEVYDSSRLGVIDDPPAHRLAFCAVRS